MHQIDSKQTYSTAILCSLISIPSRCFNKVFCIFLILMLHRNLCVQFNYHSREFIIFGKAYTVSQNI